MHRGGGLTRSEDEVRRAQIGDPDADQQDLVAMPGDQRVAADRGETQILEAGNTDVMKVQTIRAIPEIAHDIVTPGDAENEGVRTAAAGEFVVAAATVENVRAGTAKQDVATTTADDDILAITAVDRELARRRWWR
jgi:hypothetical protein